LRIVSFMLGDPGGYVEPVHDALTTSGQDTAT
jgi:hypothetical protein